MKLKVINGLKPDYWHVEIMSPLTEEDLERELNVPKISQIATHNPATLSVRITLKPQLQAELSALGCMPMEPYTGSDRAYWTIHLQETVSRKGPRTEENREKNRKGAFERLHDRVARGEYWGEALSAIRKDVSDAISANNFRFVNRVVIELLNDVAFDLEPTVNRVAEKLALVEELMGPIVAKQTALRKELQKEKCQHVLRTLHVGGWSNPDGETLPPEVRARVEPALQNLKAYMDAPF
ncbi:MAG: hypothetical protein ACYTEQ_12270 [Planctomycetota bacterium]|jgi:hypothetical protein